MATSKKSTAKEKKAAPVEIQPGQLVTFLGYPEGVPEDDRFLEEGVAYEFIEFAKDDESGQEMAFVRAPNPEFDESKKEHAERNPRSYEIGVLPSEIELAADQGEAVEEGTAEAAPEVEAPKKTTRAKGKAAEAEAPAKKTAAKKTAAPVEEEQEEEDDRIDLEGEDESVLELVGDGDPEALIAAAQELESSAAQTEYRLGGVLHHLHNGKAYQSVTDEKGKPIPAYAENGGWKLFLMDFFNIDYRKAMDLIGIYVNFTLAGVENPAERVAAMGWSKAAKVAKYLTAPEFVEGKTEKQVERHVNNLLKLADTTASADLFTAVKDTLKIGVDGESSTTDTVLAERITLRYRFLADEARLVEESLKAAREILAQPDDTSTLLHILGDWMSQNATPTSRKNSAKNAEQAEDAAAEAPTKAPGRRARAAA